MASRRVMNLSTRFSRPPTDASGSAVKDQRQVRALLPSKEPISRRRTARFTSSLWRDRVAARAMQDPARSFSTSVGDIPLPPSGFASTRSVPEGRNRALSVDDIPLPPSASVETNDDVAWELLDREYEQKVGTSSQITQSDVITQASRHGLRLPMMSSDSGQSNGGNVTDENSRTTDGREEFKREWHNTRFGQEMQERKVTKKTDTAFTFMSYNVLSDELMLQHKELYRGVPQEDISWDTRYPKLIREILGYQPDILCLQEVQADHYCSHFQKDLLPLGFEGIYKQRTGGKGDGCAIFFKKQTFILEDSLSVEFNQPGIDCLDRDNIALLVRFGTKNNLNLRKYPPGRSSQTELYEESYTKLVVANTHLLYNPNRQDVKLAQSVLLLAELDRFSTPLSHHPRLPCIVAGDFNLTSESPVYTFISKGEFSYRGLYSRQLTPYGNGKKLNSALLPAELGITDQCKHVDTLEDRKKGYIGIGATFDDPTSEFDHSRASRLYHSLRELVGNSTEPILAGVDPARFFGSGKFTHDFGLRSVYGSFNQECTTKQDRWIKVDYIFYSTHYSKQFSKQVEGNLKLVSKLQLLSRSQCEKMRALPNKACPSDHLPLVAKFLLKGTNFRG